jgi:hypothetical protein
MVIIDGIPAGNQTWLEPFRTKLGRFLTGKITDLISKWMMFQPAMFDYRVAKGIGINDTNCHQG